MSGHFFNESGSSNNTTNNTIVPSTPSWMTEQRQRRQNRRGYGRRSVGGGIHSSVSRNHKRETSSLFGTVTKSSSSTTLDFEEEEDNNITNTAEGLGHQNVVLANSTLRAQRGRPPRQKNSATNTGGLDLLDEFEHLSKPKKTRPNIPRPPSSSREISATVKIGSAVPSFKFATPTAIPQVDTSLLEFKSSELSTSTNSASGSQLTPMTAVHANMSEARRQKTVKASISSSGSSASSSSLYIEENIHPNDASGNPVPLYKGSSFVTRGGTRRSSRIGQLKAREPQLNHSNSTGSKSETTSIISKKRSAQSTALEHDHTSNHFTSTNVFPRELHSQEKNMVTRSATMNSLSSGYFSMSSTTTGPGMMGCNRSESFSSLAQRCHTSSQSWAMTSSSCSSSTDSCNNAHQKSLEKQRSQSVASIYETSYGLDIICTSSNRNDNIVSPSVLTRPGLCHRSISYGNVLQSSNTGLESTTLQSPSLFVLLQDLQQEGGGTTRSTPTAVSSASSSRKRRSMDNVSSPLLHEFDLTRSRKSSPTVLLSQKNEGIDAATSINTAYVESSINPMNCLSPPPITSYTAISITTMDRTLEDVRDRLNDVSMTSARSDDDENSTSTSSCEDEDDDDAIDDITPKELTDLEIFHSKSSYEDFKFLTKALQKWSQSLQGKVASMGLNNGCLIAVPSDWTFEHRANFSRWVATSFGFRIGNVGGNGGSFLRCSDSEGKAVLERLLRILSDYKSNRLNLPTKNDEVAVTNHGSIDKSKTVQPRARLSIKLSSTRPACFGDGPSPFCDGLVEDLLTDDMKSISLNEKKPLKNGNYSVPQFIRSMTLQPLANKIKSSALPCFRSPVGENARRSSGRRLLRLSSESAINGADFSNQLHCLGSPSPLPNRFPVKRIREHASRALQPACRQGLQKIRSSFERPNNHQQIGSKLFESPHPRDNCLALEAPSSCVENVLETPMPKHIEHWGSRPIYGKDWGESISCCDGTIDACCRIFAKSWITSEFCDDEDLSSEYHITLSETDKSSLLAMYNSDPNYYYTDYDSEVACINDDKLVGEHCDKPTSKRIAFARCDSVGASAFDLLQLDDKPINDCRPRGRNQRRNMKLRKYARMSLFISTVPDLHPPNMKRCYRLSVTPTKKWSPLKQTPFSSITNTSAFSHILSFLNEKELVHSISLVSTRFADVAAEALGHLMLVSVGCDPARKGNSRLSNQSDHSESTSSHCITLSRSSVLKSMEKDWHHLMQQFPWAQFLSDGAFKRVYKVWNNYCGTYEAMSVMDVDAIDDVGNLNLVGTELAVSVILSSLAKRNICPNFVITRGVFTCQHEPPPAIWGCKDNCAPGSTSYDGNAHSFNGQLPGPGKIGNFQYIRMELCDNGDVEEFIRNHPDKMLPPLDCRNLLFQMAFALHVAADRFSLKHYDVKLLNFLLQSATNPAVAIEDHPYVVLRYGVGSHIFRLRMHPSTANIAKLADYGTAVMRSDTDGQPVSLGQFTTLENTPPDFLILGNEAEQGYGHDSFGLGLSMLHLFTGNCPYEEILDEVRCPENLKGKLRSIWKQKSHNVIHSVMTDNNGNEDQTLYDTLYRFLVLFGIPENQFDIKKNGKVWRAINSTLTASIGRRRQEKCSDSDVYLRDRKRYSLSEGTDQRISDARRRLSELNGAMELLLSLVSFDPKTRATPLDVINSRFMADLIENENGMYCEDDIVKSFTAYLTHKK